MMGIDEEQEFHSNQNKVNLYVERRLTRLEVMLYVLMALAGFNFLGIHVLDGITFFHP